MFTLDIGGGRITEWMKHTAIIGLPRSGKTTLCVKIFDELPEGHTCIFINTQMEDFESMLAKTDTPMKSQATLMWRFNKAEIPMLMGKKTIFNIQDNDEVIPLIKALFHHQQRSSKIDQITIFVDEAHLFFPKNMNIHNTQNKIIKNVFTRGSKFNLRIIVISQKPQFVTPDVYTLCERMIVFKLHPNDYSYFKRHNINIPTVTENYAYEIVE